MVLFVSMQYIEGLKWLKTFKNAYSVVILTGLLDRLNAHVAFLTLKGPLQMNGLRREGGVPIYLPFHYLQVNSRGHSHL